MPNLNTDSVNDTAMPKSVSSASLTRRKMLMTLPVVGTAFAIPSMAKAETEDPILPLYRQWVAARKEWCRYADLPESGNWDMPETKAAESKEDAAFWAMIEMTPISMAGIAALIHVLWDLDGPSVVSDHENYSELSDHPNCKLMRAIWRGASGRNGLPPNSKMEMQ